MVTVCSRQESYMLCTGLYFAQFRQYFHQPACSWSTHFCLISSLSKILCSGQPDYAKVCHTTMKTSFVKINNMFVLDGIFLNGIEKEIEIE